MGRALRPSQQAQLAVRQRGIIQTPRGYTSAPIQIHPNDRYVRVFPEGPFDQSWQGVQKIVGGIMPGTHRQGGFWDPNDGTGQSYATRNFLQSNRTVAGTVSMNMWGPGAVGAGPASYAAQVNEYAAQANATPTLFQTLIGKLRGR